MLEKHIQAGRLFLDIESGEDRLDLLTGYASRENPKRGYLFVSKVLGKHIPVRPSEMRSVYDELAKECHISDNAYVVGMSETATGLGAGFADSLAKMNSHLNVFYQHTTRHVLDTEIWLTLDESHSHAIDHILYKPNKTLYKKITNCKNLILVDDEISTGRTLKLLAEKLIRLLPNIDNVTFVSILNWTHSRSIEFFTRSSVSINYINLVKGRFSFEKNDNFKVSLPEDIDDQAYGGYSRDDLGRLAIKMPFKLDLSSLPSIDQLSENISVIGTGEHLFLPFLVAEYLENNDFDVFFQSTTRSPIMIGDSIKNKVSILLTSGKVNYIYNIQNHRQNIVITENDDKKIENIFSNMKIKDYEEKRFNL